MKFWNYGRGQSVHSNFFQGRLAGLGSVDSTVREVVPKLCQQTHYRKVLYVVELKNILSRHVSD